MPFAALGVAGDLIGARGGQVPGGLFVRDRRRLSHRHAPPALLTAMEGRRGLPPS
ncbi:hypothetical protein [Streptomyces sp. MK7]|uniref:hypothetical protein n=1 Tax=Streptomyces sp. MK7 TaxID=3067635 RepID=UPI00292ED4DD|nr:hypothetical protein [Streptomyces sp. MK7]